MGVKMYTKHKWNDKVYFNFNYVVNLPKSYDKNKKYPLVFFLHGAGERGDDLDLACKLGYMKYVRENDKDYPFIFIAPQCPCDKYWGCYTESLLKFIDYICEVYPIDLSMVYLTGLSMGGTGTFMLAMANPEKFTAIAPICGSGICWNVKPLLNLPVMMYHGDCDSLVSIDESMHMLTAINKVGGNAKLVILNGVGHNAWDWAYEGDDLMNWFFSHKK